MVHLQDLMKNSVIDATLPFSLCLSTHHTSFFRPSKVYRRIVSFPFSQVYVMTNGFPVKIVSIETLISFLTSLSWSSLIVAVRIILFTIHCMLPLLLTLFQFNIFIIQTTVQSDILQLSCFNWISAISVISTIDTVLYPNIIYTFSYLISQIFSPRVSSHPLIRQLLTVSINLCVLMFNFSAFLEMKYQLTALL